MTVDARSVQGRWPHECRATETDAESVRTGTVVRSRPVAAPPPEQTVERTG